MKSAGIAVEMKRPKRPTARVVLLDDLGLTPDANDLSRLQVVDSFELTSADEDFPAILAGFAQDLRGRLRGRSLDAATVRRADTTRLSNADGPRYRLLAEGALTAAMRELVPRTRLRTGLAVAQAWGAPKASVDALAATLPLPTVYAEATAAALASLRQP
jgi:hypothetical protein